MKTDSQPELIERRIETVSVAGGFRHPRISIAVGTSRIIPIPRTKAWPHES
jgi:hypothetical protein